MPCLASNNRFSPSFLCIALVTLSGAIMPAAGQWTTLGPDSGSILSLVVDPATPSTLYAGTVRAGVFKSTDAGANWRPMNAGLLGRFGLPALEIGHVAIDPVSPETLYAGGDGVFKSTDGAHSWVKANQGIPANDNFIMSLAVAPSSPTTLFVGTGFNRVYRSTDAAGSWERVIDGEFGRVDGALAVAPSDSSIVYLGAGFNMVYKSTDGGDNWSSVSTGLDDAFGQNHLTVHPTNPDIVYIATDAGLFKTTNGGTGWAIVTTLNIGVFSVILDPTNPATVYAGGTKAVLKSTNSGASFVEQDGVFGELLVNTVAVDPGNPATVYAGASFFEGLFKSTDGGTSWVKSNSGLRNIDILSIAFDPQNPLTIYTTAVVGGVHKSTDGGQTWEAKRDGSLPGFSNINDIVVDPLNPSNVYVGVEFLGGIYWSDDGAESWNATNALGVIVYELGIHSNNSSTLYAATSSLVSKSTNQERDWSQDFNGLPNTVEYTALAVDPSDGETVYTGSRPRIGSPEAAGIYKTTNGGNAWAAANTGFEITFEVLALEIDPGNPDTLYAGGFGGILQKSTDGAASWVTLDTGISQISRVTSVAVDPVNSSLVYAATTFDGVYKSEDGGDTWAEYSEGLPTVTVRTLEINPADPRRVYAAPAYFGVFRYEPEGGVLPQYLFAAGDPAGVGGFFDGVALSNHTAIDTRASLLLMSDSTSGKAGLSDQGALEPAGGNQQVERDLPAGTQLAELRSDLFEGDPTLPAWIELTSDNPDIASFFQFGSGKLNQLDGGVAIENLATKFYFQRVFDGPGAFRGQAATTRLTVLNPGEEEVTVDLNYLPPDDGPLGMPRQATRKIPARSFLDEKASDIFGTSVSGGYVTGEVTEGGGVAAFEVVQLTDRPMVLGLNASTGNMSTRSFSAQLASRPDVFTNINVINTAAGTRNVELTAVRTDGSVEGDPVKVVLAAGAQFAADAAEIFGFGGAAPAGDRRLQGGEFVGSLEVEADGDGVVGDVIFGDPVAVAFAASLPLQSEPFTEAVFSQFADIPNLFFTGLAFYYPGDIGAVPQGPIPDTEITIEVILASGESVGQSMRMLKAGERLDELIFSLVPEARGLSGGYIRVTSTQPLIAQVVFAVLGGGGVNLFSAVPPKVTR